jgi:hypothetical protein
MKIVTKKNAFCPKFSPNASNTISASFASINSAASNSSSISSSGGLHQLQLLQMDEGLVAKNSVESYSDSRMRTAGVGGGCPYNVHLEGSKPPACVQSCTGIQFKSGAAPRARN